MRGMQTTSSFTAVDLFAGMMGLGVPIHDTIYSDRILHSVMTHIMSSNNLNMDYRADKRNDSVAIGPTSVAELVGKYILSSNVEADASIDGFENIPFSIAYWSVRKLFDNSEPQLTSDCMSRFIESVVKSSGNNNLTEYELLKTVTTSAFERQDPEM